MPNRAKRFPILFLLSTLVLPAVAANGAESPSLLERRVRLTRLGGDAKPVTGFVVAEDETTLTLDLGRGTQTFGREEIARLELSRQPSQRGRGALWGALAAGAVGGLVIGAASSCGSGDWFCDDSDVVVYGTMGALMAAPIGAAIGAAVSPGERWQPIEGRRFRVSVGPARGRGVAASLRFSF